MIFFNCRNRICSIKFQRTHEHIFTFQKKHLKYGPKFYSKAAYDLKRELTKHPLFKLSNMNNGYNETRGNDTKQSCQNEIKSKSNQESNSKQDFKLKPV